MDVLPIVAVGGCLAVGSLYVARLFFPQQEAAAREAWASFFYSSAPTAAPSPIPKASCARCGYVSHVCVNLCLMYMCVCVWVWVCVGQRHHPSPCGARPAQCRDAGRATSPPLHPSLPSYSLTHTFAGWQARFLYGNPEHEALLDSIWRQLKPVSAWGSWTPSV
jgi:hypothetical protein